MSNGEHSWLTIFHCSFSPNAVSGADVIKTFSFKYHHHFASSSSLKEEIEPIHEQTGVTNELDAPNFINIICVQCVHGNTTEVACTWVDDPVIVSSYFEITFKLFTSDTCLWWERTKVQGMNSTMLVKYKSYAICR